MDVSDKNVSFFKQSWVNSSNPPLYKSDQSFLVLFYEIMGEIYSSFTAIHIAFFIKNHIYPFHLLILMG